jgi:hypothetical protein
MSIINNIKKSIAEAIFSTMKEENMLLEKETVVVKEINCDKELLDNLRKELMVEINKKADKNHVHSEYIQREPKDINLDEANYIKDILVDNAVVIKNLSIPGGKIWVE